MVDFTLSTLVWILGPLLLGAAFVYAIMRRRHSSNVVLPPDHPARDHVTPVSTNADERPRQS